MKEIIVAYDESVEAEHALQRAATLAEALSTRLVVLSVSKALAAPEPVPSLAPTGPAVVGGTGVMPVPTGDTLPPSEAEIERLPRTAAAQQQLEEARRALAGRAVEVEYVAEQGEMADRLLDVAENRHADMIVVGSREHGFLERLLGRPVEETVARRAARDVLLVH